jgi:RHS repeat-associated protein
VARTAGRHHGLLAEADNVDILATDAVGLEVHDTLGAFQYITNDPATQTMAYNGANELTSSVVGAITTTYTYDQHGRTISKADGTHSARYIWFAGDKLKQYESNFPGEAGVAFNYDGFGKRRLKLVNISAPTDADYSWYRWDAGWNMIGEYAAGSNTGTTWDVGALTRHYTVQPGSQRGTVIAHADGDPDTAAYSHYFHDHLGTPQVIRNGSKVLTARQQTSPYGLPMVSAGLLVDVGYTGHKWDQELGSFYAPYRYYNPWNARWSVRDPLTSQILGLYTYAQGNPIDGINALGLMTAAPGWWDPLVSCSQAVAGIALTPATLAMCAACGTLVAPPAIALCVIGCLGLHFCELLWWADSILDCIEKTTYAE